MTADTIIRAASAVWRIEDITADTRQAHYVWARAFAAFTLRRQGWTFKRIGEVLHRNHPDVIHLVSKMDSVQAFSPMYFDIVKRYNEFQIILNNYDLHERTTRRTAKVRHTAPAGADVTLDAQSRGHRPAGDPRRLHYGHRKPSPAQHVLRSVHPQPAAPRG